MFAIFKTKEKILIYCTYLFFIIKPEIKLTDGRRRIDGQRQIFVFLEQREFGALVDDARVDGVGDGEVDQLAIEMNERKVF